MSDKTVPPSDNVSRYCPKRCVDRERITGAAFELRKAETYLSVNWLELLHCQSRDAEITEIRRVLGAKLRMHKRDRIAVGNVGEIQRTVESQSPDRRQLRVLHEPEPDDRSHSGLYGLHDDDDMLYGELIAAVCQESHAARV